jgi:hypothetical protein
MLFGSVKADRQAVWRSGPAGTRIDRSNVGPAVDWERGRVVTYNVVLFVHVLGVVMLFAAFSATQLGSLVDDEQARLGRVDHRGPRIGTDRRGLGSAATGSSATTPA